MNRKKLLQQVEQVPEWDVAIIGGGATGLGMAVDAATRGFRTILLEASDFAKGTSSRSTSTPATTTKTQKLTRSLTSAARRA